MLPVIVGMVWHKHKHHSNLLLAGECVCVWGGGVRTYQLCDNLSIGGQKLRLFNL
jgi:hypothetical protein